MNSLAHRVDPPDVVFRDAPVEVMIAMGQCRLRTIIATAPSVMLAVAGALAVMEVVFHGSLHLLPS
jgi:hypothetical protein